MLARLMAATPPSMQLALACRHGDDARIADLLAADPDLPRRLDSRDREAVVHAAQDNDIDSVRRFLRAGWPAATRGPRAQTALHWAAFHGNAAMTAEILRYDPPLDAKEEEHQGTPLGWAFFGSEHGWRSSNGDYAATVARLLDAGATWPGRIEDVQASAAVKDMLRARGRAPSEPFDRRYTEPKSAYGWRPFACATSFTITEKIAAVGNRQHGAREAGQFPAEQQRQHDHDGIHADAPFHDFRDEDVRFDLVQRDKEDSDAQRKFR